MNRKSQKQWRAGQTPLTCLITSGATTIRTASNSNEYRQILNVIESAARARVSLIQIREKQLSARTLYELTAQAARLTQDSDTLLLVNDRADIALAAGADGVHLTTNSLDANVVRRMCGDDFVIGVSTHSPPEAQAAWRGGADFAVFGPVYETPSKAQYGAPVGLTALRVAAGQCAPFPLLALGGVRRENFAELAQAGARGVAAISLFDEPGQLTVLVEEINCIFTAQAKESLDATQ